MPAPAPEDEDAYIWIDHREMEESIVEHVSERVDGDDALTANVDDDGRLTVTHRGVAHEVPLQFSPHDRYIAISSLAVILADRYAFLVNQETLDGDTHGLVVAKKDDVARWGRLPEHLAPLTLGYDYFSGIDIPYLGKLDNAPRFERERRELAANGEARAEDIDAYLSQEAKLDAKLQRAFDDLRNAVRPKPWWKFW